VTVVIGNESAEGQERAEHPWRARAAMSMPKLLAARRWRMRPR
jgi:hypothetical protein